MSPSTMGTPAEAHWSSRELDPDIKRFLDQAAASGAPPITSGTVAEARSSNAAFLRTMTTTPEQVARVEDLSFPGPGSTLLARRYVPVGEPTCEVVFFHGGGWVLGDLDGHDQLCRQVAARAQAIVTHVNYRHAPEAPFPAAALDALASVEWVAKQESGLPIVVMGDSSGGNLAASAAVQARDAGIAVALQVLLYPVLDSDLTTESFKRNGEGYLLTRDDMRWFWRQYAPDPASRSDFRAAPLRTPDLSGVAPAIVVVAGFDPLLDEANAYAERLSAHEVTVDLLRYNSMVHGFSTLFAVTPVAEASIDAVITAMRNRLTKATTLRHDDKEQAQ